MRKLRAAFLARTTVRSCLHVKAAPRVGHYPQWQLRPSAADLSAVAAEANIDSAIAVHVRPEPLGSLIVRISPIRVW